MANVRRLRAKSFGLERFWSCCRPEEKLTLVVSALVLLFCAGREYSLRRQQAVLPPIFSEPQGAVVVAKRNPKMVLVHVSGAVKTRGIQRLPVGARVQDAVHAAGGVLGTASVHTLNLAAKLHDGQKIEVPAAGSELEVITTGPATGTPRTASALAIVEPTRVASDPTSSINVNTASVTELEALPGIGPATAKRIVEARLQGRFQSLNDLDRVKGIGPKKLEALQPYVSF